MKFEVDVDKPSKIKFKEGDIILIPNKCNNHLRVYHVDRILYFGTYMHCPKCGTTNATVEKHLYNCVVQDGSYSDEVNKRRLRPGMVQKFNESDIVQYDPAPYYNGEIVGPDNQTNYQDRMKDWRSGGYKSDCNCEKKEQG